MLQFAHIDHVVLRVSNLRAMLDFYVGVLGCTPERDRPDLGLYQLRAGASLIDLVPVDEPLGQKGGAAPGREGRNLDHFCLQLLSFDADAIVGWLRERGVKIIGEVKNRYGAQGDGPSLYIEDPEGNVVELKAP
ncbi:MAG: VOC family protein, partial [Burkholderiaceae bacterium]